MNILKILFVALDRYTCIIIRFCYLVKACKQAQAQLKYRPIWLEVGSSFLFGCSSLY